MERIPEPVTSAIHDLANALQTAVILAETIDVPDQIKLREAVNRAVTALATLKPRAED